MEDRIPESHRREWRAGARTLSTMRIIGRIRWFDAERKHGVIARPGDDDVFFQLNRGNPSSGDAVEFNIAEGPDGPHAVSLTFLPPHRATAVEVSLESGP